MNFLRTELHALAAAIRFFTRLPVPAAWGTTAEDLQRSAAYFPLAGWLVGGVAALVWWLAVSVWSPIIASGLSLAASLLLTGAFHEDGFADVCDGFGGGYTKDRVLEIMRDSRVGAFGAMGLVMMLGLKWQTVAALPLAWTPWLLVAGHAVSRGASSTLMTTMDYVRAEIGKAKPLATRLRGGRLVLVLVTSLAPLALLPRAVWMAVLAVALTRVVLAYWFRRRIGGYTGDCLGAAQQVTEVVFYLGAIAWL